MARSALLSPVLGVAFQFCWLLVGFALLVVLLGVAFRFSWLLTGSALLILLEGVAFQLLFLMAAGWWLGLLCLIPVWFGGLTTCFDDLAVQSDAAAVSYGGPAVCSDCPFA